MRPFWHPLSAVYVPQLDIAATPTLFGALLRASGSVEICYYGDRMAPALRHGSTLRAEATAAELLAPGDAVVAAFGGVLDVLRISRAGAGGFRLHGDCDPGSFHDVAPESVLARVVADRKRVGQLRRRSRRLWIDHHEAASPDLSWSPQAAMDSVRLKYDIQAPHYAGLSTRSIDPDLLARLTRRYPRRGRVLVVGSGTGRECMALARAGFTVQGVDFAPEMVAEARRAAADQRLAIPYLQADILEHCEAPGSLELILFTYDVYSFVDGRTRRIELLRRMRSWLAGGGSMLLSARRAQGLYSRWILSVQWLVADRGGGGWGASHTRYLDSHGDLRRSFVHYFTRRQLRREITAAGLRAEQWSTGHLELTPGQRMRGSAARESRR